MYQQQHDQFNIKVADKDNIKDIHKREHKDNRDMFRKHKHDDDVITEVREVPVTVERKAPRDLEPLGNAGLPRAVIAASKEVPNGTPGGPTNKTVLQQHVQFFDSNNDGVVSPLETFHGFRRLGFNIGYSTLAVSVIHVGFAYPTQRSWIPILGNPFFNIHIDRLNKCKHGSDSDTYDSEGRYIPEKFEEIFSKYDPDNKGLTFNDVVRLLRGNANLFDPFGWIAAAFEWITLYMLCAKDGVITKEDARTCFDGTLFYKMEESEEKRQGIGLISLLKDIKKDTKEE